MTTHTLTAALWLPQRRDEVFSFFADALDSPDSAGRVLEIGGRDVLTYAGMMTGYARARGLKRRLISVPVLTPRLSSSIHSSG
jgi:uncharacterized protein YbjT (DUF2867 family)